MFLIVFDVPGRSKTLDLLWGCGWRQGTEGETREEGSWVDWSHFIKQRKRKRGPEKKNRVYVLWLTTVEHLKGLKIYTTKRKLYIHSLHTVNKYYENNNSTSINCFLFSFQLQLWWMILGTSTNVTLLYCYIVCTLKSISCWFNLTNFVCGFVQINIIKKQFYTIFTPCYIIVNVYVQVLHYTVLHHCKCTCISVTLHRVKTL